MAQDPARYPGIPRWVKISGIIVLVLVLLFLGANVFGVGGRHGPSLHAGPQNDTTPTAHATADDAHGNASAIPEGAREINVTADDLTFAPGEIRIRSGESIAIRLTSVDTMHDFTIDELAMHVSADAGETNAGGFHDARPGTYTFYCSVSGHRQAGMEGTLVVEGTPGDTRPTGH